MSSVCLLSQIGQWMTGLMSFSTAFQSNQAYEKVIMTDSEQRSTVKVQTGSCFQIKSQSLEGFCTVSETQLNPKNSAKVIIPMSLIRAFSDFKAFLYILIGGFSVRGCYHIKTPNFWMLYGCSYSRRFCRIYIMFLSVK